MKNLIMAIYATKKTESNTKDGYIAQALLLNNNNQLECEIHIGKMITRFHPNPDYFLQDALWQLNCYCQILYDEIEMDLHYPEPVSIEDEFGIDCCMDNRDNLAEYLKETLITFSVIDWSNMANDELIKSLQTSGIDIISLYINMHKSNKYDI
jgi:hypothetical protein